MDSAIAFLGGLGLFLTATKLLADLPMQIGETRARDLIARATRQPWRAGLAGSVAGIVLQSTNGVTLIIARLVGDRLIEPLGAMHLLAWANVGSSLLVFLASLKLRPLAMALVGICGVIFYYARGTSRTMDLMLRAALSVGIMLFGLAVMRESVGAWQGAPSVTGVAAPLHSSVFVAPLIGFVSALITQSSSTTTILALTAVGVHAMSLSDGLMITLAATAASGLSILLLGAATGERERQVIVFQALAKAVGVIVVLPPLLVDRWLPHAGLERVLRGLVGDPGTAIAIVFMLCQIVSLSVFLCAKGWIAATAARSLCSAPFDAVGTPDSPNDVASPCAVVRKLPL